MTFFKSLLAGFFIPAIALAALSDGDRALISPRNLIKNPGAEFGKANVTASVGTLAIETGAANRVSGSASFSWDSSAAAQTLSFNSTAVTSGSGLNADLYYSCYVKCATGTCTHLLELTDGTATTSQAIVSSTTAFQKVSVYHPGSGTMTPRLKSVAANEPVLYIDDCRFERADDARLTPAPVITEWVAYTPTFTGMGTVTGVGCEWRRVGDSSEIKCQYVTGTVTAVEARVSIPSGQVLASAPTIPFVTTVGTLVRHVGSVNNNFSVLAAPGNSYLTFGQLGNASYAPLTGVTANVNFSNTESHSFFASVPIAGWQAMPNTATLDQFGTSWSGYHGSDCLWGVTQTTYAADFPVDTSCTFTERVNRNFGTVTSANNGTPGSNLPGITFTPKRAGTVYSVCALPTFRADDAIASGSLELLDGSGTIIGDRSGSGGGGSARSPLPVCGIYVAPSTASVSLKLRGKGQSGVVDIDTTASSPTGSIDWTIYDLSSLGAVSFKGVPVSNEDLPAHHWAHVTASGASCAITSQDGTWLSSCSQTATGTYDYVIAGSTFSATAYCSVTKAVHNAQDRVGWYDKANSSSTLLRLRTGAGSAGMSTLANDSSGEYILACDGKR